MCRLVAHNGVLGGLDALRDRLGEHAALLLVLSGQQAIAQQEDPATSPG